MRKIVLNISDVTYEKLRFEAMAQEKSIQDIVRERLLERPFSKEVEEAFEEWVQTQINNF